MPPSFLLSFVTLFLHSFLRSFLPSFLPSFVCFFLPSFVSSFLPSFLCLFLPLFVPSFLPSFLPPSRTKRIFFQIAVIFLRLESLAGKNRFGFSETSLSRRLPAPLHRRLAGGIWSTCLGILISGGGTAPVCRLHNKPPTCVFRAPWRCNHNTSPRLSTCRAPPRRHRRVARSATANEAPPPGGNGPMGGHL
ncbi:hypothetical protein EYF80_064407 [Liparis tanakae]|uniref:Uncharacterized protein n=1 Tax=Liparis tanakae TaxID=230148 RepID=A0A4Z2EB26_9TELE|nr:hypothetical protein EYF80_064407 [Liparis tanakae]